MDWRLVRRTVGVPRVFKFQPYPGTFCGTHLQLWFGCTGQTSKPSAVFGWEFDCSGKCVLVEGRQVLESVSSTILGKSLGLRLCFLICKMKLFHM